MSDRNQLVIPQTGTLWYGAQDTLDAHNSVQFTLSELSPMELSNLRVRATELLATQGVSRDQFADHYMVNTYGDGKLAVISITGTLMNHHLPLRLFGYNVTTYGEIQQAVQAVMADPRVEKVVLQVESGGGSGSGLFRTSNFIERMGKVKDFTTFSSNVMGSAAYWLGVNSPQMVAEPLATIGSIGVYAVMTSYAEAKQKFGISSRVIRAGEFKALGHPDEPISEKAVAEWQSTINQSYGAFLDHVSSKRNQDRETFRINAAEGREFSGSEALKVNLVDEIMVFDDMIEAMLSTMSKTVPASGAGRNLKMDEGAMNKKMLALLQKAGVTLTDEQMSALASGASFESIGIEATLAAELTAAQAAGDVEEEESGGEQNLDADPAAVAEAARLAAEAAKTNMAGSDLTALLDRIQALTVESTTATANLAAMTTQRDKLEAEVKIQEGHVVRLSGIAAQAINRMETALRGTTTDDLDNLEPAALVSKYQNVRDKFEQTFPVGRKTAAVVDKPVTGEQRPRPDTVAEAAQNATKI